MSDRSSSSSSSSYETIDDVITVSSYEEIEKEDSESSYEEIEEVLDSEYEDIEEEIVVSDYVTDEEDEKPESKSKSPPPPPLAEGEPKSTQPPKKGAKNAKPNVKAEPEPRMEKTAPPARKRPPVPNQLDSEDEEEPDSHSEASDADDEDSDEHEHEHKPKPKKKSDAWDPNPEDAPASPTNNEKPVERIKWNSSDYYCGDLECFNAWRKYRPEKAKKKKRIERIEIVTRRVQTKPRRVHTVRRKKEKPPKTIRIRHTHQIVKKKRVRKAKEKPPPIARPKQPGNRKGNEEKTPIQAEEAERTAGTNKTGPTEEAPEKTYARPMLKEPLSVSPKPVQAALGRTPRVPPEPVNAKLESNEPGSPPAPPKKFSDLVANFSKGGPLAVPKVSQSRNLQRDKTRPSVPRPDPVSKNTSPENTGEEKPAEYTKEKQAKPTLNFPPTLDPTGSPSKTTPAEHLADKVDAAPKPATLVKNSPAPASRPKKTLPKPTVSNDESSESSVSSGSDSDGVFVPPVLQKSKEPPKPPPTQKLADLEEPDGLKRAQTSEVYTALMVRDCPTEPNIAEYERLADVTEKYFTRYLKRQYKGIFYDVKVSVKKTKFECGIPGPEYNIYVEWNVNARFRGDTGDLRGSSSHLNSKSNVPSDHQLLRTIVNSLDLAYLEKIAALKQTPFCRSKGIYLEEVVGEDFVQ